MTTLNKIHLPNPSLLNSTNAPTKWLAGFTLSCKNARRLLNCCYNYFSFNFSLSFSFSLVCFVFLLLRVYICYAIVLLLPFWRRDPNLCSVLVLVLVSVFGFHYLFFSCYFYL